MEAITIALETHSIVASSFEFRRLNPPWLHQARRDHQVDELQKLWYPPYSRHAGGSGLAVRRELHERIGGFDESLSRLQDTDYCIRAQKAGGRLVLAENAVIHVRHRATLCGLFRQSLLWAYFNTVLYVRHGRGTGQPSGDWKEYREECKWILKRLKRVGSRSERSTMACRVGWQLGLLLASMRYRVSPLWLPRKRRPQINTSGPRSITTQPKLVAR